MPAQCTRPQMMKHRASQSEARSPDTKRTKTLKTSSASRFTTMRKFSSKSKALTGDTAVEELSQNITHLKIAPGAGEDEESDNQQYIRMNKVEQADEHQTVPKVVNVTDYVVTDAGEDEWFNAQEQWQE